MIDTEHDEDWQDIDSYLSGQQEAGDRLVCRHSRRLYRFVYSFFSGHRLPPDRMQYLVDDLGQDVWWRLLRNDRRNLRQWHASPEAPFWPFLSKIALSVCIDHTRSSRPEVTLADPPDAPDPGVARERDVSDAIREIERLAGGAKLNDRYRKLLVQKMQGLSGKQIAKALGCTEGTAWVLVHRLIDKLKLEAERSKTAADKRPIRDDREDQA